MYIDAGVRYWLPFRVGRVDARSRRDLSHPRVRAKHHQLDSTSAELEYGARIAQALAADWIPDKHLVINAAENCALFLNGPYPGNVEITNSRVCRNRHDTIRATLGIPPTTDVAKPRWAYPSDRARIRPIPRIGRQAGRSLFLWRAPRGQSLQCDGRREGNACNATEPRARADRRARLLWRHLHNADRRRPAIARPKEDWSARDRPGYSFRVNAIVDSFEPRRSQSPENRLKSTIVLAALQQALRRKARTSRRKSTSVEMARNDTLAISEQVDAFDRDADVRADDGVVAIRPLLAGAGPL
ncbi:MAG: hypothetical protein ACLP01_29410, partial [Solirubrobacteraceae bacterium]